MTGRHLPVVFRFSLARQRRSPPPFVGEGGTTNVVTGEGDAKHTLQCSGNSPSEPPHPTSLCSATFPHVGGKEKAARGLAALQRTLKGMGE